MVATREQRRLDGVDRLVLVFPVFWRPMHALPKGWIDRVFIDGRAFSTGADAREAAAESAIETVTRAPRGETN